MLTARRSVSEIFADALYYIALINPKDRYHGEAKRATTNLLRPHVTTIWVLMEVADALAAPTVRRQTHRFLQNILLQPKTAIITDLEPWFSRGLDLYGKRSDKDWSLTDCISFEVMKERGIAEALTGDRHFIQAGFQTMLSIDDS
jgi:hypothetical protein